MFCTVYVLLLLALPAALLARPLAERVDPQVATWVLTGTAAVLSVASSAALALLTFTGLLRLPAVAAMGRWSVGVLRQGTPAWDGLPLLAGALLAALTARTLRTLRRRTRALRTAAVETARLPEAVALGGGDIVVLDDPAAEAFAVPGPAGRIVVSTGMLAALAPEERTVLIAHERAHLRDRHYLFVTAAHLAAAANPLLRPLARHVSYTVERWADERAAHATGDRRRVACAIGKAALAGRRFGAGRSPHGSAALHATGTPATPSAVPRRVAALLEPPPSRPPLVIALTVTLTVLSTAGICCADLAHDVVRLLELARAAER
ncbi:M56 family metallopeptidase [Streptomyces sp. NPDC007971]|uniref:M56 family metallopeptidase n=1 Tax=Streptomyces sp. NPDC007971 TaxID=3364799 RepID=UPI0036E9C116